MRSRSPASQVKMTCQASELDKMQDSPLLKGREKGKRTGTVSLRLRPSSSESTSCFDKHSQRNVLNIAERGALRHKLVSTHSRDTHLAEFEVGRKHVEIKSAATTSSVRTADDSATLTKTSLELLFNFYNKVYKTKSCCSV